MLHSNTRRHRFGGLPRRVKIPLTPMPVWVHHTAIKATAPLLAAMQERVIRWLFFCPDCTTAVRGGGL
jgi:hypothetical protein